MQGIDGALDVKWRSIDVGGERRCNAAYSVNTMRGADCIIGNDGELA